MSLLSNTITNYNLLIQKLKEKINNNINKLKTPNYIKNMEKLKQLTKNHEKLSNIKLNTLIAIHEKNKIINYDTISKQFVDCLNKKIQNKIEIINTLIADIQQIADKITAQKNIIKLYINSSLIVYDNCFNIKLIFNQNNKNIKLKHNKLLQ